MNPSLLEPDSTLTTTNFIVSPSVVTVNRQSAVVFRRVRSARGGEFGFVPAFHPALMATGCHRGCHFDRRPPSCHPERTSPPCHPERSRGIWLRIGGAPRPQADVSTTLRSARHDKGNELTRRDALRKATGFGEDQVQIVACYRHRGPEIPAYNLQPGRGRDEAAGLPRKATWACPDLRNRAESRERLCHSCGGRNPETTGGEGSGDMDSRPVWPCSGRASGE